MGSTAARCVPSAITRTDLQHGVGKAAGTPGVLLTALLLYRI